MFKSPGYFLIRVSESRVGYTLSYQGRDRCRHYKINAFEDGHYVIVGEKIRHRFLQDLVDHHRKTPIIPYMEVLTVACGQNSSDKMVHAELFAEQQLFPQKHSSHDESLQPNPSLSLRSGPPGSQEDISLVLPYPTNNLRSPTVPTLNSQSNRFNPSVGGECSWVTALQPTLDYNFQPMPKPRKIFLATNPPSNLPPDLPARTATRPLTQKQTFVGTVSESPGSPIDIEYPFCANIQPAKNQETKPSLISQTDDLKKKLPVKTDLLKEFRLSENDVMVTYEGGDTENQNHMITRYKTHSPQYPSTDATNDRLPEEYNLPAPFAPGYSYATVPSDY
ncbi:hematopoietic SH2 domain-containing protein homolog isoform X2 [Antennarius striatus]